MKTNINFKNLSFIIPFLISGFLLLPLFQACMETLEPAKENTRNVKVYVSKLDLTLQEKQMIANADVIVYEEEQGNRIEVKRGKTNSNGVAIFDLKLPLIGKLYTFQAIYNNEAQFKNTILICNDTTLNFLFTDSKSQISCGNLDLIDTLIFIDYSGSTRLKVNTPENINKYTQCYTITLSANSPGDVTLSVPQPKSPFSISSIMVNNENVPNNIQSITLKPGESVTFCYDVSTLNIGNFQDLLIFNAQCSADGSTGQVRLSLMANVVEPDCDCNEVRSPVDIVLDENIQVGKTYDFKDYTVFTNNLACDVNVTLANSNLGNEWVITEPKLPILIRKGESLKLSGRFTPSRAGETNANLELNVVPVGTNNNCELVVNLQGNGCNNVCPFISFTSPVLSNYISFGVNSPRRDTLSDRSDNRVFVSTTGELSIVTGEYYVYNPDTACSEVIVTIDFVGLDNFAREFFNVSPNQIILAPGEFSTINVSFTAPDIARLNEILQARKGNGPYTTADSMFSIRITLNGNSCSQIIIDDAIVTTYPDITPVINLRAYAQRTPQKPNPENEVYQFGTISRTILKNKDGSDGPYPPNSGHIWIDVNNNDQSATPPQEPILKLVDNSLSVKLWKTNVPESDFADVVKMFNDFSNDPAYNTGYGPGPITNIQIQNVYAFKFNEFEYGLIYIRRVDNGTEQTSSKQSGIEFRAIYPILIY